MITIATKQDAREILDIYTYYVNHTAITFEYRPPALSEFENFINTTLQRYPFLLSKNNGIIEGYAYAKSFINRPAYDWSVEVTIYLKHDKRRAGLGRALYEALEKTLSLQHFINLNACIAYPQAEDEYLTKNSVRFHEHMGYRLVGEFYQCGYKFHRWYNMVWMEKHLSPHPPLPLPVVSFDNIRDQLKDTYHIT